MQYGPDFPIITLTYNVIDEYYVVFYPIGTPDIDLKINWGYQGITTSEQSGGTIYSPFQYPVGGPYTITISGRLGLLTTIWADSTSGGIGSQNTPLISFNFRGAYNVSYLQLLNSPIQLLDLSYLPLLGTVLNRNDSFTAPTSTLTTISDLRNNPLLTYLELADRGLSANLVNNILFQLDQNNTTGGRLDLGAGGNNLNPNAAPTSGPPNGIAAKASLEGKGWTVVTN